jgi:hypothetical protein
MANGICAAPTTAPTPAPEAPEYICKSCPYGKYAQQQGGEECVTCSGCGQADQFKAAYYPLLPPSSHNQGMYYPLYSLSTVLTTHCTHCTLYYPLLPPSSHNPVQVGCGGQYAGECKTCPTGYSTTYTTHHTPYTIHHTPYNIHYTPYTILILSLHLSYCTIHCSHHTLFSLQVLPPCQEKGAGSQHW